MQHSWTRSSRTCNIQLIFLLVFKTRAIGSNICCTDFLTRRLPLPSPSQCFSVTAALFQAMWDLPVQQSAFFHCIPETALGVLSCFWCPRSPALHHNSCPTVSEWQQQQHRRRQRQHTPTTGWTRNVKLVCKHLVDVTAASRVVACGRRVKATFLSSVVRN